MIFVVNEATAAERRFPIYLVDATDGITAETGEAGGQPQVSKNGGAWANTTATLSAVGNGAYYVELTATELNTIGMIQVRYKSANTAEFNLFADVAAIDVNDPVRMGLTALPNANAEAAGGLYTRGTGAGQINQDANGRVDTRTAAMAADVLTAAATAADFSTEVNAAVLAVLGALNAAASSGDPNTTNTMVQILKQITNTLEGTAGIPVYPAAANPANGVSIAEALRQVNTNAAASAGDAANCSNVLGPVSVAASAGDPNTTNQVIQYLKQIVNTLEGSAGMPTWPAAAAPANAVSLAEAVRQIYTNVGATQTQVATNLDATVSSRATPAQVNTEVLDVLNTDTFAEPGQGAPAATASLVTKISYLYKFLRNRVTVTSSTISVYNDATTVVDHKSTHSDSGTVYDRGEFGTGP